MIFVNRVIGLCAAMAMSEVTVIVLFHPFKLQYVPN